MKYRPYNIFQTTFPHKRISGNMIGLHLPQTYQYFAGIAGVPKLIETSSCFQTTYKCNSTRQIRVQSTTLKFLLRRNCGTIKDSMWIHFVNIIHKYVAAKIASSQSAVTQNRKKPLPWKTIKTTSRFKCCNVNLG